MSHGESVALDLPAVIDNTISNSTLTVVIRFHPGGRIACLDEALFSLAIQDWDDLEVLLAVQNGTAEMEAQLIKLIRQQPWRKIPSFRVIGQTFPPGVDGRTRLLNLGVRAAQGRFLAFLDYDDCVYHHAYSALIRQLQKSGKAIAVGGCRRALIEPGTGHAYIVKKDQPFAAPGRKRLDLCRDNFVPIHSYVLDRARVSPGFLYFDESFCLYEDYEFLLRLWCCYEPDLTLLDTPVCEYRIRTDGSNSVIGWLPQVSEEKMNQWKKPQSLIAARRQELIYHVPLTELLALEDRVRELENSQASILTRLLRKGDFYLNRFGLLKSTLRRVLHSARGVFRFWRRRYAGR